MALALFTLWHVDGVGKLELGMSAHWTIDWAALRYHQDNQHPIYCRYPFALEPYEIGSYLKVIESACNETEESQQAVIEDADEAIAAEALGAPTELEL